MMAGIVYRTCEFDDVVGQAVSSYRQYTKDKSDSIKSQISLITDTVSRFTDIPDLNDALEAASSAMGIPDINSLRSRFGLYDKPIDDNSREEWLLANTGTCIINGKYIMQSPGGIELDPYRTAYNFIGLNTLESVLSNDSPFAIAVIHDGVVHQDTPISVSKNIGVPINDLDDILFMWIRFIDSGYRSLVIRQGIQPRYLFDVMNGASTGNITVVTFDRVDVISQLRSMNMSDSDLTLLFNRDVPKAVIDTQELRPGDNEDTLAGPYQSTPYPGEIARELLKEIRRYPSVGEKTFQGAPVLISPISVLVRSIDLSKSFNAVNIIRRTSDKMGPDEITGQAVLSIYDSQMSEITSLFELYKPMSNNFIEQGSLFEEVISLMGIDAKCGVNTNSAGIQVDFWSNILTPVQEAAINNLIQEWRQSTANINFSGSLLDGISVQFVNLVGEAESLLCQADNILTDTGAEGGVYDVDGATNVAIVNTNDVYQVLRQVIEMFQRVGPDMAVTSIEYGNMLSVQSNSTETPENTAFLNQLKVAKSSIIT